MSRGVTQTGDGSLSRSHAADPLDRADAKHSSAPNDDAGTLRTGRFRERACRSAAACARRACTRWYTGGGVPSAALSTRGAMAVSVTVVAGAAGGRGGATTGKLQPRGRRPRRARASSAREARRSAPRTPGSRRRRPRPASPPPRRLRPRYRSPSPWRAERAPPSPADGARHRADSRDGCGLRFSLDHERHRLQLLVGQRLHERRGVPCRRARVRSAAGAGGGRSSSHRERLHGNRPDAELRRQQLAVRRLERPRRDRDRVDLDAIEHARTRPGHVLGRQHEAQTGRPRRHGRARRPGRRGDQVQRRQRRPLLAARGRQRERPRPRRPPCAKNVSSEDVARQVFVADDVGQHAFDVGLVDRDVLVRQIGRLERDVDRAASP